MCKSKYWVLALVVCLTACGKQLNGRYEAVIEIPQMRMPGIDPKLQKQIDAQMKGVQSMYGMSLEFNGAKVKMINAMAVTEHRYRIDGNKLEVTLEGMGQKAILPMTIEADGSINYLSMRYRKVP